jgi:hypothetical protein
MVENDGKAAAAEAGIGGFKDVTGVDFEVVIDVDMDIVRVATAQASKMWPSIKLASNIPDPSILQVSGIEDLSESKMLAAAALLGQMGGILGIAGFKKVGFSTPHTLVDILQSEIRAAESIAQSA